MSGQVKIVFNQKEIQRWMRNDCDSRLVADLAEDIADNCGEDWVADVHNGGDRTRGYVRPLTVKAGIRQRRENLIEKAIGQIQSGS